MCICAFIMHGGMRAQVFLTKDEALKRAFGPSASIERRTVFLTDEQVEQIRKRAKAKVESKIVTYYVGKTDTGVQGYAFFETHVVRTMPATYMVVVSPDATVRGVEILAFYEPEDYLPPARWLNQFDGQRLSDELWVKRSIRNISGATLSAHAITEGSRRILATFEVALQKEK